MIAEAATDRVGIGRRIEASVRQFTEIPILDLSAIDGRAALADEMREICHEIGFFVVTNHGVDPALVRGIFDSMQTFFALPESAKLLIDKRASRHFRGWEPVGAESTNNRPDIREQIDLWTEWPARDPEVEPSYLRLLGPNQWLPDEVLPGHRELVLAWFRELRALADRLLRLLSEGLGLAPDHLSDYFGDEAMSLTKLISYPPTPVGGAGVNAHHDTGFLTVLAAGTTPGLQVANTDGEWIDVPVVPDSFVINLGEIMQAITGNYFVATPHRVITDRAAPVGRLLPWSLARHPPRSAPARPPFRGGRRGQPAPPRRRVHGGSRRDRGGRRRHAQPAPPGHVRRTVVELLRPQLPRQHGPPLPRAMSEWTDVWAVRSSSASARDSARRASRRRWPSPPGGAPRGSAGRPSSRRR